MPKAKQPVSPQDLVGRQVRALPPFDRSYPDTYTVADHMTNEDGAVQYTLEGVHGWFAAHFVELV